MQLYKHRQIGTLLLRTLGSAAVLMAVLFILAPEVRVVMGTLFVLFLLLMILFYALTVEVTPDEVRVSLGPGWIRRRFRAEDILGARAVRNPWYYGWGIRLTPHGWLFNVSGFDAVEVELKSKRKFRIGTDDPERLLEAIRRVAGQE